MRTSNAIRGTAHATPSGSVPGATEPASYIPKPDGRQRPLAIAALEDKIVQRATAAVLNGIYEEDFLCGEPARSAGTWQTGEL